MVVLTWLGGIAAAVLFLLAPALILSWSTDVVATWWDFVLVTLIWFLMLVLALWTLAMENDQ